MPQLRKSDEAGPQRGMGLRKLRDGALMSALRQAKRKARKAAKALLSEQGATMAQLDRVFSQGLINHRVYDRLITPLLDAQDEGTPRVRISWAEVFPDTNFRK